MAHGLGPTGSARAGRKPFLLLAHRWISLTAAAVWLVQALTGILLVFHWELDDATVAGPHRPLDLGEMEVRLERMAPPGSGARIDQLWTTAGADDRFDVYLEGPGQPDAVLVDGVGNVLRVRQADDGLANGGLVETLITIHHNLLAGDSGAWVIGLSGILLLTNLTLGLLRGWPRRGTWRRSLLPPRKGPVAARRYAWHRGIGLWAVVPALFTITAGTLLTFEKGVGTAIGAQVAEPGPVEPGSARPIGFAQAVRVALGAFPGSSLAGVYFPSEDHPYYHIRVLQPGEPRRAYGTTHVFVGATDGRMLARFDALEAGPARRFMDILFPLHTGELGGTAGRIAVMAIGAWLVTTVLLGVSLWWKRRRKRIS